MTRPSLLEVAWTVRVADAGGYLVIELDPADPAVTGVPRRAGRLPSCLGSRSTGRV